MSNIKYQRSRLSVIIIARNEEEKIRDCLESVKWVDEIIVVDNDSTDGTVAIAKKYKAKVVMAPKEYILKYSELRNLGLKKAQSQWIFYVDADERVTPELKYEISELIANFQLPMIKKKPKIIAYAIPRRNIILGKEMKHGGWWPDYVKRLFIKQELKGWVGDLHEEPQLESEVGHLSHPLIHLKEKSLSEMLEKTNQWSEIEAKLLYNSQHPKMTWWRFLRIMATELWFRLIVKRGFLDGVEGVIYSIYQMWSKFVTYGKLWEMQIKSEEK